MGEGSDFRRNAMRLQTTQSENEAAAIVSDFMPLTIE